MELALLRCDADHIFPGHSSYQDLAQSQFVSFSQEGRHLWWERGNIWHTRQIASYLFGPKLFNIRVMQEMAVLEFEKVAWRRNNKKSKSKKSSLFF